MKIGLNPSLLEGFDGSSISPVSAISELCYKVQKNNKHNIILFMNRYQLKEELGAGQYGKVFAARDMSFKSDQSKKRVAIKIVKYDPKDDDDIENIIT